MQLKQHIAYPAICCLLLLPGVSGAQEDTSAAGRDTVIDGETYRHIDRFDDGTLRAIGNFDEQGNRTGKWWFYKPDGTLKMSGRFERGSKEGPWFVPPYTLEYFTRGKLTHKKKVDPGSTW